ncbi:MAG: chloride channel protein [Flavobacteriales bacterium]|nr:chloride channel protein [Flavobacteriales bacterium]
MKKGTHRSAEESWGTRIRAGLRAWLGRMRGSSVGSHIKDLWMLALPYQVAAVVTALVAVGFTKLFMWVEHRNVELITAHPHLIFLTAPVAFLFSWWLVTRFSPMAGSSGVPQLIAAAEVADDEEKHDGSWRFLNVRIIFVRVGATLAMVMGGGAIGREGPILQIAGSVYRVVHKLLPPFWPKVSRRVMMVTGGAAGLSAAFNTPLGGIVFAMEELTRTHIGKFRTAVLSSVIISGMTAQWLLGPYLMLGYPKIERVGPSFMYTLLVISAVAGAMGVISGKAVLLLDKLRRAIRGQAAQGTFVLLCALTFACVVNAFGPMALGSGEALMDRYLFATEPNPSVKDVAGRLLGSIISTGSGSAGMLFGPALSSGAAIGGLFGHWFGVDRGQLNILVLGGMCAFLTGITRSPFTSAILILEMTDRHSAILQLMYAAMIASMIAHAIDDKSYYERMKDRLIASVPGLRKRFSGEESS